LTSVAITHLHRRRCEPYADLADAPLNSISSKSKTYLEKYQKLDHVRDQPFVLAIAPFDQPAGYLQVNRSIEAALYGYYVDEEAYLTGPGDAPPAWGKTPRRVQIFRSADRTRGRTLRFSGIVSDVLPVRAAPKRDEPPARAGSSPRARPLHARRREGEKFEPCSVCNPPK